MSEFDRIDSWKVVRELGTGDFATTYLVKSNGHEFALKLAMTNGRTTRERMHVEEEALQQLSHPGIPSFVESGIHHGRPYIVMSLARGTTSNKPLRNVKDPAPFTGTSRP
jgi:serine/threonine protein kinase